MKKFEQLERNEKEEITVLLANWLSNYTHDVISKVLVRRDEIINNEFVVGLLKELKEREEAEKNQFVDNIGWMLRNPDEFNRYDPHNYPLIHAGSYRNVLYDMYIRDI